MRFLIGLLTLSLLFPPVTVASITLACLDMEEATAESMPMDHAMMDDETHACCPSMPEEGDDCAQPVAATSCCPDVQVVNHQHLDRLSPLTRYVVSISLTPALSFITADPTGLPVLRKHTSGREAPVYDEAPPPLRALLCTYLI